MTLSRKEFFRQGFFSLGDNLLKAAGMLPQPATETEQEDNELLASDLPVIAVPRNEYCLARNCGCYSCFEQCEQQAITLVMGKGIKIDKTCCTGCGSCLSVCPVTPKAIRLVKHNPHTV